MVDIIASTLIETIADRNHLWQTPVTSCSTIPDACPGKRASMRFLSKEQGEIMRELLGLSVLLVSGFLPAVSSAADKPCDRSCLQKVAEQYMHAVAANDVKAAPLMPGYRQTENTKVTRPGTGIWGTVTGVDSNPRFYLDPMNGEALWFGTIDTRLRKKPEVGMVRLKVVDREIAEAEWIMSGPGLGGMQGPAEPDGKNEVLSNAAYLAANKPAPRVIPVAKRLSRAALEGIANSYFDGLSEKDGTLVLAHPNCFRVENGELVTGRPLEGRTDGYEGKTNCTSRYDQFNMSLVANRRFFAIDEEQQVVATSAIFMRTAGSSFRRCVFHEIFYIDDGRISKIYSAIYYPTPDQAAPNWAPYQGNFPLPASFGAAR